MMKRIRKIAQLFLVCGMALCLINTKIYAKESMDATTPEAHDIDTENSSEQNSINYDVFILDTVDLLNEEEETLLYENMGRLSSYGNMLFSTVELNEGSDYQKYAEDFYYERYGNEPGIHFQIDMGNRKLTLSASTGMEQLIGSERTSIVDNIYQLATQARYYECAKECFREIEAVLNDDKIAHGMKYIDNAIIAVILSLMIHFIVVFTITGKKDIAKQLLGKLTVNYEMTNVQISKGSLRKKYSPISSGSGSGGSSGGSSGGGFSGGSSSHGF